ncbi:anthranilate phosphoribosyltransferase [Buchnera aphidicola]|uniref:anthranilate phosphoribosyltransferase n=1 Tax=Buchnera aphidicola TaxID=9 RepID=UPI003BEF0886
MKNIYYKHTLLKNKNHIKNYSLFQSIISGELSEEKITAILKNISLDELTIEEMLGAIYACLEKTKHFPRPSYIFSDIVGTGGDSKNTINISTASAFVAAECGFKIIKHCNQGISSKSGSADLLKQFDINLNATAQKSRQSLDQFNICFLFAQKYNDAFKYSINIRKIIKNKTIFNLLGPFLNPAIPVRIIIGVYDKKFMHIFAHVLNYLNYERAIIVHGNGTDEVSLNGITYVTELCNGKIFSYELKPEDFGINTHPVQKYIENSPEENHDIISKIMKGTGDRLYEELIAVNVAILLKVFGYQNLKENTQLALEKIRSGAVYNRIKNVAHILKED